MATSSRLLAVLLFCATAAQAREAASSAECEQAATRAPVADAKSASSAAPGDLHAQYRLADAWSEAGCFGNALQVLAEAARQHPSDRELQTRLRVARSVVGEERFFDNLDRAEDQARVKRNTFRCSSLQDLAACAEVVRATPGDGQAFASQGDALLKAGRAGEALDSYRRGAALAPNLPLAERIASAQAAQAAASASVPGESAPAAPNEKPPVRVAQAAPVAARYSNLEPETRSH